MPCPRSCCGVRRAPGKTTLATILAEAVGAQLITLSAVSSGVADARKVMEGAKGGLFKTVLFVDEVHRWSKAQQDVLLPAVEQGTVTLIGATTENPYFSLNTPLLSRCLLLRLEPLSAEDVEALLRRALGRRGTRPRRRCTSRSRTRRSSIWSRSAAATHGWRSAGSRRPRWPSQPDGPEVDHTRRRGRCGAAQGHRVRPPGGRPLRRRQRVHQVDPWLRSGRRALLAGPHARGRRGPALHRPAADRARERGHRPGRPDGAAAGHGRRPRRRARRPARGAPEPGAGNDLSGPGAQVQQRLHGAGRRPGGRPRGRAGAGAPARRLLRRRRKLGHGQGYVYPHDEPDHWADQAYRPDGYEDHRYFRPSGIGEDTEDGAPGTGPLPPGE